MPLSFGMFIDTISTNIDCNGFIVTMTNWLPDLEHYDGPKYRRLAEAIGQDIRAGTLAPGDRLPPQRDLAFDLGVTLGTVSRAYALAAQRGLVRGEVGRGTVVLAKVAGSNNGLTVPEPSPAGTIDMRANVPAPMGFEEAVADVFARFQAPEVVRRLRHYTIPGGAPQQRESATRWLGHYGLDRSPGDVLITAGAHQAVVTGLATVAEPGDIVLTEALSFPGFREIAATFRYRVQGVAMDANGIVPEAFEEACRRLHPKVLITMPTFHNPTARVAPLARREAIIEIARRHDVTIVEDYVYGPLCRQAPPTYATLAPDITFHASSISKALFPGLRIGFLVCPPDHVESARAALHSFALDVPLPSAEAVAALIDNGEAFRLLERQRAVLRTRHKRLREKLPRAVCEAAPECLHILLELPGEWRASEFVRDAEQRGVYMLAADNFAVGKGEVPAAVRVALGAPETDADLDRALDVIGDLLRDRRAAPITVV
jgi:DNA-binding transcriptional MocR family regulator